MKTTALRRALQKWAFGSEELGDDDIIEVVNTHRSGTYSAIRPPPLPARTTHGPAPSDVSDLVTLLARLSDPGRLLRANRPVDLDGREAAEGAILTTMQADMTVDEICDVSPLGEESTRRLLAKFLAEGAIAFVE